MGYCPKCDMEFVEGIEICSDCGSPLVDRESYIREQEKIAGKEKSYALDNSVDEAQISAAHRQSAAAPEAYDNTVYMKASDRYNDMKSSASAFIIVGVVLIVLEAILFSGVLPAQFTGAGSMIFKLALALMAIGSFAIAFKTLRQADGIKSKIDEEQKLSKDILESYISSENAESIDGFLTAEGSITDSSSPEEKALKRIEYIEDSLIIRHGIDNSYAAALAEDIYTSLFEK